jgi:hypothetical protein
MARVTISVLAALACAALLPGSAAGQEAPQQGSPSGSLYEIPAEGGRDDAAPRAAGDPAGGDVGGGSPIRTENGLGTSAQVPGAPAADRAAQGGRDASSGAAAAGRPVAAATAAQPSSGRAILLAALAAVVGLALGAGARLAARARG